MSKILALVLIVICVQSTFINHRGRRQRQASVFSRSTGDQIAFKRATGRDDQNCQKLLRQTGKACFKQNACKAALRDCENQPQVQQSVGQLEADGEQFQQYLKQLFQDAKAQNVKSFAAVTTQIETLYSQAVQDNETAGKDIENCLQKENNQAALNLFNAFVQCIDLPIVFQIGQLVQYINQTSQNATATGKINFTLPNGMLPN